MSALIDYLAIVVDGGDYMNDMLTHLPDGTADAVQVAGWLLSLALGY